MLEIAREASGKEYIICLNRWHEEMFENVGGRNGIWEVIDNTLDQSPMTLAEFEQQVVDIVARRRDEFEPSLSKVFAPGDTLLMVPVSPADGTIAVKYTLELAPRVALAVYDAAGNQVIELAPAAERHGVFWARWDTSGVSAGRYEIRLFSHGWRRSVFVEVQ